MKNIRKVKAEKFNENGDVSYRFEDVGAHWAMADNPPTLDIYFEMLGEEVEITIPISEIYRTIPPRKKEKRPKE